MQSHCRNADIDLLFVRADDVPEYVQDGVVDCGITGLDLVSERECDVEVLFGSATAPVRCRRPCRWRTAPSIEDLAGRRIATSHPRIAAKALAERGIAAELVQVTGSVEISPRLGLADAIIDLVSTGSTCARTGCVRSARSSNPKRCSSARSDQRTTRRVERSRWCSGSVINARANRYLLCNVAKIRLDEVTALLPTSGSPTIMDLATPGVVAVHALVPAAEIWSLLPRLEAAARASILTLPVERMVP